MTRNIKYRRFLTFLVFICSVISITACTSVATNLASSPSPTNLTRSSINPTDTPVPTNTAVPTPTSTATPESSPTPTLPPTPILYPAPYGSEIPMDFEVITAGNIDRLQQVYMLGSGLLEKVAWSPDQNHFFISGYYGVYLYSSETWDILLQIPSAYGFDDWRDLSPVADFSTDGRYFGVAGSNGLLIYDVTTLEQVIMLPAQDNYRDVAFFHSADRFATCTLDGKVAVYDLKGNRLADYQVETETQPDCQQLAISTDDSRLVWVSGKKIHNWNFITGEVGKNPEFGNILKVAISADGSKIAANHYSNDNHYVSIWDSTSGIIVSTMWGKKIRDYSPVTDQLAIINYSPVIGQGWCFGPVSIWNFSDLKLVREIIGSIGYSSEVIFNSKGNIISSTADTGCEGIEDYSRTRYIRSWDLSTGEIVSQYPGKFSEKTRGNILLEDLDIMQSIDINLNFQILGLMDNYGSGTDLSEDFILWDQPDIVPVMPLRIADPLLLVPPANELVVSDLSFDRPLDFQDDLTSPDGKFRYLVNPGTEGRNTKFQLIRIEDNQLIAEFNNGFTASFTPDSNLLIVFGKNSGWQGVAWAEVWDLQNLERVRSIHLMIDRPLEMQWVIDGRLLQIKSSDETIRWWAVLPEE